MKRKVDESGRDDTVQASGASHHDKRATTSLARSPSPITLGTTATRAFDHVNGNGNGASEVDRYVRGISRTVIQTYSTPQEFERAQALTARPNAIQSLTILLTTTPPPSSSSSSSSSTQTATTSSAIARSSSPVPGEEQKTTVVDEEISPVVVISASVIDLIVAHVRITICGSNVLAVSCTCGYEDPLWCAHIAAVFLKLQADRTTAIPRFNEIRSQISGMSRVDLENLICAQLLNPTHNLSSLLSSCSPTTLSTMSTIPDTPSYTGVANWAAYDRKFATIFDKPRADACSCQCHKAYEWYRGVNSKGHKNADEGREAWSCVTCRVYHDECREFKSAAQATIREAIACAKYMIKNGRLMDAHSLMKSATSAFLVAVKAQSKGNKNDESITTVLGHISAAIRRVALSFDTPLPIRDEYVSLVKEWKRVHPTYDFGENYVEWTTEAVARVMRGDETAIRAFAEPPRVADDRIQALTAAKKYVECLFYARAVNQVKICAHMLLYLRRLVEANAVATGAITSLDDALEFAKLMNQQELVMAAAGQLIPQPPVVPGTVVKPVPTTFSFLQQRLEALTKIRSNTPANVIKDALELLCSTIRNNNEASVTKERLTQVQFLIGKLATSVEQKFKLVQLIQEQGFSVASLEIAMEHLLDNDAIKRGHLTRAMCSWIADVAWAAALVTPTVDQFGRQCRSEDHIIAFLRVLIKRREFTEALRLVNRWLEDIDDTHGRAIGGLSVESAQLLLETAAHVGATELTTMVTRLLRPAANQKATYVSKLISALEQTSSTSSVNLQVIYDLAQKKLQWSLNDKKPDECRSAMAQLMTISQKQDIAVAAAKEDGEVKEGDTDVVDITEEGKSASAAAGAGAAAAIGRHTKQTVIYLSHIFKDGSQIMDLANFLKDRQMIAEALPLALKALQAHSWSDEKTGQSSSSPTNDDRFTHMAEYLDLARRALDQNPPTAASAESSDAVDYLNLAKSMALELVTRYPTRDHFIQCRTLFLELEAKYPGGSKLAKKWTDVQTQVIKDLLNSSLQLGGGIAADKHTGTVLEIFLAAACYFEAADLLRIRTDRLQTPALLTHAIEVLAMLGQPLSDSTYDKIWPTGIKAALSSLGNSGIYGQARDVLLHAIARHFPSKLQAAAGMLASGLAVAIKKRGEKTTFDASSVTKSSSFFQWVTASQLVFQLADAEMEWMSTLRDIELYNGMKQGFAPAFTQFRNELPPFITGIAALTAPPAAATPASAAASSSISPSSLPVLTSPAAPSSL